LSASAALVQIVFSPVFGSMLDSIGRKPAVIFSALGAALANGAVAVHPSVVSICAAKVVGSLGTGFFFLTSQAMISDIAASRPDQLGAAMGVQMALTSAGFFLGSILAGQLSDFGLPVIYGISAILGAFSVLLINFGVSETLPSSKRFPLEARAAWKLLLKSPLSCTRLLFHHGQEVRILSILLMLQSLPLSMGDVFQIFAKAEWNLTTKDYSSFIAIFGILGILANTAGSVLIRNLGIKRFTKIAILSSMGSPIGASFFGFRGILVGIVLGFLGMAQSMGIIASLVSQGAKSGVPQGEFAGQRSSLLALLKVIGPIWYSTLYIQGHKVLGVNNLPFLFNIGVAVAALVISELHLS
jgi:MFS family permease